MKLARGQQHKLVVEEVWDITDQYPKRDGVIQHLSVETNRKFNFKQYFAELESLGIPAENVGVSFCG